VLVTSATGLIGDRLAARLANSGPEVRCLLLAEKTRDWSGNERPRSDLTRPVRNERAQIELDFNCSWASDGEIARSRAIASLGSRSPQRWVTAGAGRHPLQMRLVH
jgi:nucleoside-diphosphate-sugar epimerase